MLGSQVCTRREAEDYRSRLLEIGADAFIRETITKKTISAKKLISAFAVELPIWLVDAPDHACYPLLGKCIVRELAKRRKLPQFNTIDDAAELLKQARNVIVITGAGISTSLGIPDFRSRDTGFYSKLQAIGIDDPQEVFDIQSFDEDPTTFYNLAGDILPDLRKWSPTHEFIRLCSRRESY